MVDNGLGEFLFLMLLFGWIWWREKKNSPAGTGEQYKKSTYQKYNMNWRDLKE